MDVQENVHVARGVGGWFATIWMSLLLMTGCLLSMLLLLIVGGSLAAQWRGSRSLPLMLVTGGLLSLTPVFIFNGFITWLRQQWNKHARFFDTFFSVFLMGNTALLALFVLWMPAKTSSALYQYGNWLFDKDVATLFQISEEHPVLRTGRRLIKRMAYLLEVEPGSNKLTHKETKTKPPPYPPIHALGPQPKDSEIKKRTSSRKRRNPLRRQPQAQTKPRRHQPIARRRRKPTIANPLKEVSIRVRRHGNSLIISAGLPGRKSDFLLDTGASFLSLSSRMAHRLNVYPPRNAPTLTLHTANGVIKARVGLLPYFKLGSYRLTNVAFVLCDACGEPKQGVAGLLGLNILRRFLVTIDQGSGYIRLRPPDATRFNNQAADMRPFLKWPKRQLRGYTTNMLVRRVFKLTGLLRNQSHLDALNLRFRVTYLKNKRKVGHYEFNIDELSSQEKRRITIRDKNAPRFESYRVELIQGSWD